MMKPSQLLQIEKYALIYCCQTVHSMNCKHSQTKFTDISNSKLFNFFLDEVVELPGLYCFRKIF